MIFNVFIKSESPYLKHIYMASTIAQWLRGFIALAKDLVADPFMHMTAYNP